MSRYHPTIIETNLTSTTCNNPKCSCDPCLCVDCRCGTTRLGDLERQVMEVLWTQPDTALRGRTVADKLPEYAYTTVATVLDRLSRKGEVHRTTEGRVHLYRATGTPGAHTAKAMRDALDRADDPGEALTHFVRLMPEDQLDTLRRALEARR